MSDKKTIITFILSIISLLAVIVMFINTLSLSDQLSTALSQNETFKEFIRDTFSSNITANDLDLLDQFSDNMTNPELVVYIPLSICRACFSSLLLNLQDVSFDWSKLLIICEKSDYEINAECVSKGIDVRVNDYVQFDEISNILVYKKIEGYKKYVMKFDIGSEAVLREFLLCHE